MTLSSGLASMQFDASSGDAHRHRRAESSRRLLDDVVFWLTAEGTQPDNGFHLEFPAGDVPGNNRVGITQGGEGAFVNLGLTPYFRNTVVFDVEHGLVGFGPCG